QYVVTTMKYDKTIPGWGNGDTERACDIKAGNCTDFHSLFMSLARAKGIPARFVIGFPLTAADGQVKGYHCWAEFWVKGKGWIPVDASDASKLSDNAKREYLFGNLDPNRVQFTVGRDLTLTPRTSEPLNFFIYPRAESNGKPIGTPAVSLQFKPLPQSASR
ncbi:MAG: transglutaminase-like domain-containing protein, partial [Thermoanaerobaculia bacterium]